MMKIDKNFKTQWMNEISKMSQAIGNNDLYEATKHKEKADALFEEAKRINEYFENPSKTFGVMNNAIKKYVSSEYLKENKKPIADYISMMKSDKNLVSENKFFDAIDTYNKTIGDSKGFIDEVTKRIKKEINPKTINESNDKMVNFMKKYKIPTSPLILAVVVGVSMEQSFRQSMMLSDGNPEILFRSPICWVLFALTVFSILWPFISDWRNKRKKAAAAA